jgi:hypothetical protein
MLTNATLNATFAQSGGENPEQPEAAKSGCGEREKRADLHFAN